MEGIEIGKDMLEKEVIDTLPVEMHPRRVWKIALLGPPRVGKTTIMRQWTENKFTEDYIPSVGATIDTMYNGRTIEILDTPGYLPNTPIPIVYTQNIDAYLLVYNTADKETYRQTIQILHKLQETLGTDQLPTILVENKADLEEDPKFNQEDLTKLPNRDGEWLVKITAKEKTQVDALFTKILSKIN